MLKTFLKMMLGRLGEVLADLLGRIRDRKVVNMVLDIAIAKASALDGIPDAQMNGDEKFKQVSDVVLAELQKAGKRLATDVLEWVVQTALSGGVRAGQPGGM